MTFRFLFYLSTDDLYIYSTCIVRILYKQYDSQRMHVIFAPVFLFFHILFTFSFPFRWVIQILCRLRLYMKIYDYGLKE